jgi:hypothetical protein
MSSEREVAESPVDQGSAEKRFYTFSFENSPLVSIVSAVVAIYDLTPTVPVNTSETMLSSTAGVVTDLKVRVGLVQVLVPGHRYRLQCRAIGPSGELEELFTILTCDF